MSNERPRHHIAVDLDGTLAHYDHWRGSGHIGDPIPETVERAKRALGAGHSVTVFTARVAFDDESMAPIQEWCRRVFGFVLPVTAIKHPRFTEFWDDRAVTVALNGQDARATIWSELGS